MRFNLKHISNIEIEGVDTNDYPDFCDAYISSATYKEIEMTNEEIDYINNEEPDFVYQSVLDSIF